MPTKSGVLMQEIARWQFGAPQRKGHASRSEKCFSASAGEAVTDKKRNARVGTARCKSASTR